MSKTRKPKSQHVSARLAPERVRFLNEVTTRTGWSQGRAIAIALDALFATISGTKRSFHSEIRAQYTRDCAVQQIKAEAAERIRQLGRPKDPPADQPMK